MCRSIQRLRSRDQVASDAEIRAAALQYVRKVTGYRVPSAGNAERFEAAVDEVAAATRRVLVDLAARHPGARAGTARGPGA